MLHPRISHLRASRSLRQPADSPATARRSRADRTRYVGERGLARMGFAGPKSERFRTRPFHGNLGLFRLHERLSVWLWLRLRTFWLWLSGILRRRRWCISHTSWSPLRRFWRSFLRPILLFLHPTKRTISG